MQVNKHLAMMFRMERYRACAVTALLIVMASTLPAAAQPQSVDGPMDHQAMARRIDQLLQQRWASEQIVPASSTSDHEFLRRVFLDLTGRIPTVAQARQFLDSQEPDRREQLIDRLLDSPLHANHLATLWRGRLLPADFDPNQLAQASGLQNWLRQQFASNLRYDQLVAEFLVATGSGERGPAVYYTAHQLEPEKLAASTSRVFLGMQIHCAQCHDHPFGEWTQQDFWGYAAFFAQIRQGDNDPLMMTADLVDLPTGEVTIPGEDRPVIPKYPQGVSAEESEGGTRRRQLAIWMVSRDNPFLARALVNWAWSHLFGKGIIHPVDDLGGLSTASDPQLLDELTAYFVRSGFDLRHLYRTLANTRAYQLSSQMDDQAPTSPRLFSRMAIKVLTPDQLYDSFRLVMGQRRNDLSDPMRQQFLAALKQRGQDVTEYEGGLTQALMLLNGPQMHQMTDTSRSRLLVSLQAPFFSDRQRIEVLYLATLSRRPTQQETDRLLGYVESCDGDDQRLEAMSDVLWALVNSAEFALNH